MKILVGIQNVLTKDGVAAVIIGDVADPGKAPLPLAAKIWDEVGEQTGLRLVNLIEDDLAVDKKVSRIWGETKGKATARDCVLVLARPGASVTPLPSLVDWDEPYKDGGPDAAHKRLRNLFS